MAEAQKSVSQRLAELEGEQEAAEARLAMANIPDVVVLHPSAAERYRQKVEDIQAALTAGDAAGVEAVALVRELIQRVRVVPTARGAPLISTSSRSAKPRDLAASSERRRRSAR